MARSDSVDYEPSERERNGARIVATATLTLAMIVCLALLGVWHVGRAVLAGGFTLFIAAWCWWVFAAGDAKRYVARGEFNMWKWLLWNFSGKPGGRWPPPK